MLVLSRKDGQRITLTTAGGERITLVLDRSNRRTFRVSIDAPQTVRILRDEIAAKLFRERAPQDTGKADRGTARQQGKD